MSASGSIGAAGDRGTAAVTQALLGAAILFSGFAALCYQVAWQRALTQSIGSDALAVTLVVAIFMLWLGVGALAARHLLLRPRQQVALVYAAVEVLIGLYGVASLPLLRRANEAFAVASVDSVWADVGLNMLVLALPVVGMGMTTPLIVQAGRQAIGNFGRTVGYLYGLNILGAGIGALVCGLILIEWLGLQGVTQLAASLNVLAAALALWALRAMESSSEGRLPPAPPWRSLDAVAVLFGFGTLAMQVLFFRVLHAYLTLSTLVFPVLLCSYLLLMSAGQWIGGQLADRHPHRLGLVIAALFASGALLLFAALSMPPAWAAELGALRFTSFNGSLVADRPDLIGDPGLVTTFSFGLLFMTGVLGWSALFPVLLKLATRDIDDAGASFGRLYGMYAAGNVAGTLLTGMVLLPWLGTGRAAAVTVFVVAAGVLLLARPQWRRVVLLAAAGVTAGAAIPSDYYKKFQFGNYRVVDVVEGLVGVATVTPTSGFYSIVDMSRTASASALTRDPSPDDLYQAWRWNHTELMALDPSFRPRRVLVIGIGHAYLPHALLDIPSIREIVVVDLSPEIVEAVRRHTATDAKRVFSDPRVRIEIADGRRYVQSAARRGEQFDLVQIKINEPWHAGAGNLFTVEFFSLVKSVLSPGGYLGVRPLVGHLSDGLAVFEAAVYPGYYHLFFKNGPLQVPPRAVVPSELVSAWSRELPGRNTAGQPRRDSLQVMYFSQAIPELQVDVNSDDRPTFEYYWLRQRLGTWKSPREHLWEEKFNKYRRLVPVEVKAEP